MFLLSESSASVFLCVVSRTRPIKRFSKLAEWPNRPQIPDDAFRRD